GKRKTASTGVMLLAQLAKFKISLRSGVAAGFLKMLGKARNRRIVRMGRDAQTNRGDADLLATVIPDARLRRKTKPTFPAITQESSSRLQGLTTAMNTTKRS